MIVEQENHSCYFIHIPRTGGRYVSYLFEETLNTKIKYYRYDQIICGIEMPHLHFPLYNQYLSVDDMPHITIVRNPFDRFFSGINIKSIKNKINYYEILINKFENQNDFNFYFDKLIEKDPTNLFLPQHKFISKKTQIWKYEWGFGKNFQKWIYDMTKINVALKPPTQFVGFNETKFYQFKITSKIEDYVKKYYLKDFEIFNYKF